MPKFMYAASYTADGVKGVLKDGGSSRRDAVKQLIESAGGTLEAFYFAFGDRDLYIIADFPDNVSSLSATLVVNASGAVQSSTVVLLTPEEVDRAASGSAEYRPPGG